MVIGLILISFAACSSHATIYSPKPGANDLATCRSVGSWLKPHTEAASISVSQKLIQVATSAENQDLVRAGHAAQNALDSHGLVAFKAQVNHMIVTCETFGLSLKNGLVPVS